MRIIRYALAACLARTSLSHWKTKSFTDGDITLHFAIFDILHTPEIRMTLAELIEEIDRRLSSGITFDESTLRKKLKEYTEEGIIQTENACS